MILATQAAAISLSPLPHRSTEHYKYAGEVAALGRVAEKMVTCTLKLHCEGKERVAKLDTEGGDAKNVVASLDELCAFVAKGFDVSRFRLTYLGVNDERRRIADAESLYEAATEQATGGVLYVKVTANSGYNAYNEAEEVGYLVGGEKVTMTMLAKRFSRHEVECYNCEQKTIVGVRFVFKQDADYSVCDECIGSYDGDAWEARAFPWKTIVPKAPLSAQDNKTSEAVKQLQQLLTALGYMSMDDTNEWQGSFQWRTAEAVKKLRSKYAIKGGDMSVYDDRTMKQLEKLLKM